MRIEGGGRGGFDFADLKKGKRGGECIDKTKDGKTKGRHAGWSNFDARKRFRKS